MSHKLKNLTDLVIRYPHVTICLLIILTMSGFVLSVRYYAEESRKQTAYDTAKSFEHSISALHRYYSQEIVSRAKNAGVELSADFTKYPNKLPFPATLSTEFGGALREMHPNLDTSLYSDAPFLNRQNRVQDDFEKASLAYLSRNPTQEFHRIEVIDGVEVVRYARALIMKEDCVACHNQPEYGFEGRWKVGDMRGARQVSMPVPDVSPITGQATTAAIALAIFTGVLASALAWPVVSRLQSTIQRTESLAEELQSRNRSLVEANEVKSQFLAGISHDLRTPLNAIVGFAQVLRDGQLGTGGNERGQTYARFIHDSGLHLQGVIDQLLDVSNGEAGKWTLVEEIIDLEALIRSMRPMLEPELSRRGMKLDVVLDRPGLAIHADGRALRRILTNLADNAGKYSGGNVVEIRVTPSADGEIVLAVSDDGVGIPPEAREQVRRLGGRDRDSLLASNLGMGMGLWLVEALASLHEATIEIDTAPILGGCRVSVTFPNARSRNEAIDA